MATIIPELAFLPGPTLGLDGRGHGIMVVQSSRVEHGDERLIVEARCSTCHSNITAINVASPPDRLDCALIQRRIRDAFEAHTWPRIRWRAAEHGV